jgi:DNA-directed RNA polymerase specialized sigma24 family protein
MINAQRTPMDLMDDIYTLAYWMTGSETAANELVNRTYLHVESHTPEREVFKTFRECYFDSFAGDTADCISQSAHKPKERLVLLLLQRDADIKLSVLLSEIPGLKHRMISKIIGKPLDTIRVWLSEGRKSLAEGMLSFDASLLHGVSVKRSSAL